MDKDNKLILEAFSSQTYKDTGHDDDRHHAVQPEINVVEDIKKMSDNIVFIVKKLKEGKAQLEGTREEEPKKQQFLNTLFQAKKLMETMVLKYALRGKTKAEEIWRSIKTDEKSSDRERAKYMAWVGLSEANRGVIDGLKKIGEYIVKKEEELKTASGPGKYESGGEWVPGRQRFSLESTPDIVEYIIKELAKIGIKLDSDLKLAETGLA